MYNYYTGLKYSPKSAIGGITMTELELLERAKLYMERLANGINPLDGSAIGEEEVVNNVRLSRCFFYVADVLRQVIENGGVAPQPKQSKGSFALPMEKRRAFAFSNEPIIISEIVKRFNDLAADENVTKLTATVLTDWLVSIDMLAVERTPLGNSAKRPTSQGAALGITVQERNGMNGPYCAVVYDRTAQQFLVDNLDSALEMRRQMTENQGQPWSPEQDQFLRQMHQAGADVKQIALALKRNSTAVRARIKKLGFTQ